MKRPILFFCFLGITTLNISQAEIVLEPLARFTLGFDKVAEGSVLKNRNYPMFGVEAGNRLIFHRQSAIWGLLHLDSPSMGYLPKSSATLARSNLSINGRSIINPSLLVGLYVEAEKLESYHADNYQALIVALINPIVEQAAYKIGGGLDCMLLPGLSILTYPVQLTVGGHYTLTNPDKALHDDLLAYDVTGASLKAQIEHSKWFKSFMTPYYRYHGGEVKTNNTLYHNLGLALGVNYRFNRYVEVTGQVEYDQYTGWHARFALRGNATAEPLETNRLLQNYLRYEIPKQTAPLTFTREICDQDDQTGDKQTGGKQDDQTGDKKDEADNRSSQDDQSYCYVKNDGMSGTRSMGSSRFSTNYSESVESKRSASESSDLSNTAQRGSPVRRVRRKTGSSSIGPEQHIDDWQVIPEAPKFTLSQQDNPISQDSIGVPASSQVIEENRAPRFLKKILNPSAYLAEDNSISNKKGLVRSPGTMHLRNLDGLQSNYSSVDSKDANLHAELFPVGSTNRDKQPEKRERASSRASSTRGWTRSKSATRSRRNSPEPEIVSHRSSPEGKDAASYTESSPVRVSPQDKQPEKRARASSRASSTRGWTRSKSATRSRKNSPEPEIVSHRSSPERKDAASYTESSPVRVSPQDKQPEKRARASSRASSTRGWTRSKSVTRSRRNSPEPEIASHRSSPEGKDAASYTESSFFRVPFQDKQPEKRARASSRASSTRGWTRSKSVTRSRRNSPEPEIASHRSSPEGKDAASYTESSPVRVSPQDKQPEKRARASSRASSTRGWTRSKSVTRLGEDSPDGKSKHHQGERDYDMESETFVPYDSTSKPGSISDTPRRLRTKVRRVEMRPKEEADDAFDSGQSASRPNSVSFARDVKDIDEPVARPQRDVTPYGKRKVGGEKPLRLGERYAERYGFDEDKMVAHRINETMRAETKALRYAAKKWQEDEEDVNKLLYLLEPPNLEWSDAKKQLEDIFRQTKYAKAVKNSNKLNVRAIIEVLQQDPSHYLSVEDKIYFNKELFTSYSMHMLETHKSAFRPHMEDLYDSACSDSYANKASKISTARMTRCILRAVDKGRYILSQKERELLSLTLAVLRRLPETYKEFIDIELP